MLVVGIVGNYLWWVHGNGGFDPFAAKLLLLLPILGGALLWHMYRQRGLYVLIYPTGLLRRAAARSIPSPGTTLTTFASKFSALPPRPSIAVRDGAPIASYLPADVPTFQLWNAGLALRATTASKSPSARPSPITIGSRRKCNDARS